MEQFKAYFKRFSHEELSKLRGMSFRDKLDYIWEYYKLPIVAIAAVLFILGSIVNSVWINPPAKPFVHFFHLTYAPYEAMEALAEELDAALIPPEDRKKFKTQSTLILLKDSDPQMEYAMMQKFFASVATGEVDFFLFEDEDFEAMSDQGYLTDLREFMSRGQLDALGDRLLWAYVEEHDAELPVGIRMDDNPVLTRAGIYTTDQILSVCVSRKNDEHIQKVLEYICSNISLRT